MNRRPLSEEAITSLHGAGGELMGRLLSERILPKFALKAAGPIGLGALDDGAALELPPGVPVITLSRKVDDSSDCGRAELHRAESPVNFYP